MKFGNITEVEEGSFVDMVDMIFKRELGIKFDPLVGNKEAEGNVVVASILELSSGLQNCG